MAQNPRRNAKNNVEVFCQAVADLKEYIDEVEPTGKYTARTLLVFKYETENLLNHLSAERSDIKGEDETARSKASLLPKFDYRSLKNM